jgi:outer membrane protein assembly factor BamB
LFCSKLATYRHSIVETMNHFRFDKSILALMLILVIVMAALISLSPGCKAIWSGPNGPTPGGNQQVTIPWPGLANSPWPTRLHDPQHTGRTPNRGPQVGRVVWRYEAPLPIDFYASPVLGEDGSIYIGALSGQLYSVSPAGTQLWEKPNGGSEGSCTVSNLGAIYCAERGQLYSYDWQGNLNWSFPLSDLPGFAPYTPALSMDGRLIYVARGMLYAITAVGSLHWKVRVDSTDEVGLYPALSPDGTTMYVAGKTGLYAVDTSGQVKWRFPQRTSEPAVDNAGNIYVTTENMQLYSLSPSGSVRWQLDNLPQNGGRETEPVIGWDGTVYVSGIQLVAVNYQGSIKWQYPMPSGLLSSCVPAIDGDGTLYFGRSTSRTSADTVNFVALRGDGTVKFMLCLRNPNGTVSDIDSNPCIDASGKLYVGCDRPYGRYLFCIE